MTLTELRAVQDMIIECCAKKDAEIRHRDAALELLRQENKTLFDLVKTLFDNKPDDLAADGGITVYDVWCEQVRRFMLGHALKNPKDEDVRKALGLEDK